MEIIGLRLPSLLEANLGSGTASLSASDASVLESLLHGVARPFPALYGLEEIKVANRLWTSSHVMAYLGTPSPTLRPGDIDPRRALIIGRVDEDSPIALDYRADPPRVVYLGGFEHGSYWMELAPTYEDLIATIRLSARRP